MAVTRAKRVILDDFLALQGRSVAPRAHVLTYDELARSEAIPRGAWILTDLDALGPAGRAVAATVRDAARTAGYRVLNDPERTLGRLDLLDVLHRDGINAFRAVPAGADLDGLRYPVFVRGATDHFGPASSLLDTPAEVEDAIGRTAGAGRDPDDLVVVEFEAAADDDGLYTKYGACVLGERVFPHHVLRSRSWMVKFDRALFSADIAARERRYVEENPHEERLRRVFELAGAEYGRVDYSLGSDGGMQVWEINLCPILDRGRRSGNTSVPASLAPRRSRTKEIFYGRFLPALAELDPEDPPEPPLPLRLSRRVRDEAIEELAPPEGGEGLATLLRAKTLFGRHW